MLPITEPVLPLVEIAEYWSREIDNIRSSADIYDELISAFWRDELHATGATGNNNVDRLALLKFVNRQREHPGFIFADSPPKLPLPQRMLDGRVILDPTIYTFLPINMYLWSSEVASSAYTKLAALSAADFHHLIRPAFTALNTTREFLSSYCKSKGYPPPRFWYPKESNRQWNNRKETAALAWFKRIAVGRKCKSKEEYLADVRKEFPGIPKKALKRVWKLCAPPAWTKSGPVNRTPGVIT